MENLGSAALAVAIKSGSARSPKDRANADLLARVVPGIALLASGLLRSRIRPDASAADPRVPPVNGFFFVVFCVATEAPEGAHHEHQRVQPGTPRRASGASAAPGAGPRGGIRSMMPPKGRV